MADDTNGKRKGHSNGGLRPWHERTVATLEHLAELKAPGAAELGKWVAKNIAADYKPPGTDRSSYDVGDKVQLTDTAAKEYKGILGDKAAAKFEVTFKERGSYKIKSGQMVLRVKFDEIRAAE
jgi:molybdopterin biosynthesis enzyme